MNWTEAQLHACVERALREDLDEAGDLTTVAAVTRPRAVRARVVAKAEGVVAGLAVAERVFAACDATLDFVVRRGDGERVVPGDEVCAIHGDARGILAAERTALNFLQRLSGIATLTRRFVDAVAGTGARILDTRKTTPGLRALEKHAVRMGGGDNHRFGLFDQILLKENHFACAHPERPSDVVARCVRAAGERPVIAEARDLEEAAAVVAGGAGVVLLDNFPPGPDLERAVRTVRDAAQAQRRTVEVEVSGGVHLGNVADYAAAGVDRISIGALTHSAPALDLSLLVEVAA